MLRQFALAVHSAIHVFFLVPQLHENEVAEHAIAEAYLLCQRVPGRIGSADQRRTKAGNGGNQQKDAHKEKRVNRLTVKAAAPKMPVMPWTACV